MAAFKGPKGNNYYRTSSAVFSSVVKGSFIMTVQSETSELLLISMRAKLLPPNECFIMPVRIFLFNLQCDFALQSLSSHISQISGESFFFRS